MCAVTSMINQCPVFDRQILCTFLWSSAPDDSRYWIWVLGHKCAKNNQNQFCFSGERARHTNFTFVVLRIAPSSTSQALTPLLAVCLLLVLGKVGTFLPWASSATRQNSSRPTNKQWNRMRMKHNFTPEALLFFSHPDTIQRFCALHLSLSLDSFFGLWLVFFCMCPSSSSAWRKLLAYFCRVFGGGASRHHHDHSSLTNDWCVCSAVFFYASNRLRAPSQWWWCNCAWKLPFYLFSRDMIHAVYAAIKWCW